MYTLRALVQVSVFKRGMLEIPSTNASDLDLELDKRITDRNGHLMLEAGLRSLRVTPC